MDFRYRNSEQYILWVSVQRNLIGSSISRSPCKIEQMKSFFQQALGLQTERLSKRDVQRREPALASRQVGALWAKDDHRVEPRKLNECTKKIICQKGGSFYEYQNLHFQKENNHISWMSHFRYVDSSRTTVCNCRRCLDDRV